MPRARTGTVKLHGDHWDARITLDDGSRPWIHLPPGLTEKQARARAAKVSTVAHERGAVRAGAGAKTAGGGETVAEWSERWLAAREAKGLTSVKDDRGRLRKWVLPRLGSTPIAGLTKREIESLVEYLDGAVRGGRCSWKTARNTWGVVSKMLDDACRSKVLALRALTDNPAAGVRGPDNGVRKSKSYLYPAEWIKVAECERVPIRWRRLFALAIYTYTRAGELEALDKEDVDLDAMVIHVHRAIDRSDGNVKATKTNNPRRIPIEGALVPLLRVLLADGTGGRLVDMPPACDLSARLRQYLTWAGVTRAELHAGDATRKRLTFHDLRASGITWMALRGDEPIKVMRRAGHEDIATTMLYVREAENLTHAVGAPFPTLPDALCEASGEASEGPREWGQLRESMWKKRSVPSGIRNLSRGEDPHGSRTDPDVKADLVAPISTAKPRVSGTADDTADDTAAPGDALARALEAAVGACVAGGDLAGALAALDALEALRRARGGA